MATRQQPNLNQHLTQHAAIGSDLEQVIVSIAAAAIELERVVAEPPTGAAEGCSTINAAGDIQQPLDIQAHQIYLDALAGAPVQALLSEEADDVIALRPDAPFSVAIDPLDGSSNILINGPVGTVFAVFPSIDPDRQSFDEAFLSGGRHLLAAGYVLFGPATVLALSVGAGTDVFTLDLPSGEFVRSTQGISVPPIAREFAINVSNHRHWDPWLRRYVDDLVAGETGPNAADFNMRWIAALLADCHRIMVRGGIFLYPADERPGYRQGRLRLLYEAYPIAFLIEQANGLATDGDHRILDKKATSLHQRTPFLFGSRDTVAAFPPVAHRDASLHTGERSPLFAQRGLFRS